MSEMRRAAAALVERRTERFESRHGLEASQRRLGKALERAALATGPTFAIAWSQENGTTILEATFLPSRRTRALLQTLSLAMLALVALSAWVITQGQAGAERFLVPLFTVLAIVGLPLATLGLASSRAAREASIRKAIRVALQDEEPRFPPQHKWPDED
jgi:hypothetical protein